MFRPISQRLFLLLTTLLLGAMFVRELTSALGESQTVDEGTHLAAGYSYWRTNDFRLNAEHPPLMKLLASAPLLLLPLRLPVEHESWKKGEQWQFAHEFLYRNIVAADTILLLGRLPMMVVGLGLGLVVTLWSRRLWGTAGGVLSAALLTFDPNFLAHAHYVTTDVGASLVFLLAVFFFGRYLERQSTQNWAFAVFSFALAQVTKFSSVILWPLFLLFWWLRWLHCGANMRRIFSLKRALYFFISLAFVTQAIVFTIYGFEIKQPIEDPEVQSLYADGKMWKKIGPHNEHTLAGLVLRLTDPAQPTGAFIRDEVATVSVPNYNFFKGFLMLVSHNYRGHASYLMGEFRTTGRWYYFPIVFLVKTPPPTLLLIGLTLSYLACLLFRQISRLRSEAPSFWLSRAWRVYKSSDFTYMLLLLPPFFYFATSCTSNINLGIRHLLPVYPFLFILAGVLATVQLKRFQKSWRAILIGVVAALLASSARIHPHYLAYFSELVGGPDRGIEYLADSNLDWGQELKRLARYLDDHAIPALHIAYFGEAPVGYYLKNFRDLPKSGQQEAIQALDGWAAISATMLAYHSGAYGWLLRQPPTVKVGYAIFLYDLRKKPKEAAKVLQ